MKKYLVVGLSYLAVIAWGCLPLLSNRTGVGVAKSDRVASADAEHRFGRGIDEHDAQGRVETDYRGRLRIQNVRRRRTFAGGEFHCSVLAKAGPKKSPKNRRFRSRCTDLVRSYFSPGGSRCTRTGAARPNSLPRPSTTAALTMCVPRSTSVIA